LHLRERRRVLEDVLIEERRALSLGILIRIESAAESSAAFTQREPESAREHIFSAW